MHEVTCSFQYFISEKWKDSKVAPHQNKIAMLSSPNHPGERTYVRFSTKLHLWLCIIIYTVRREPIHVQSDQLKPRRTEAVFHDRQDLNARRRPSRGHDWSVSTGRTANRLALDPHLISSHLITSRACIPSADQKETRRLRSQCPNTIILYVSCVRCWLL